ncbi:hypothetical protein F383_00118 [Gossypium arboreum]|uniref:Uncharacterized protein n=1 Tax=Gossypium arboreum TaxID=29729 RepID=A0A0B0NSZ2_GOSAR|nr:hypothetical protein F383_00118 [Gossypium arboreum]
MADLFIGVSQSSLLHLQPKLASFQRLTGGPRFAVASNRQLHFRRLTVTGVVSSDSKAPTTVTSTVGSEKGGIDIEVDTGNGGGDKFDDRSGGGGDGGDNSGGGGDSESKGEGEFSDDGGKKKMALSMSQKLTLGYAALVGVGGVMGYVKSGSQKSLAAGGLSAAVLYYVYTQLPTNPVFASSVGLGERIWVYWGKKEREIPSKFKFTHQSADQSKFFGLGKEKREREYICCTFGSDGFPFQEVGKSLSRWGCITRVTCDDRGLPAWHHAEYALVKCSGDGNVN